MGKKKKKNTPDTVALDSSPQAQSEEGAGSSQPWWRLLLGEYVAWGLVLLLLLRPVRDGVVYPSFNLYLMGIIWVLSVLVLMPILRQGKQIRCRVPLGLFAAYLLVVYFTGFDSVQRDVSHRELVQQLSYFFLFFVVSNGVRTRLAWGIVVSALVIAGLMEAVYSVLHANFILPYVRQQIIDNPRIIVSYFHTAEPELTAELKNRLEMQRAFGTFLFPNALAGYLVLSIPFFAGHVIPVYRRFKDLWDGEGPHDDFWSGSFGAVLGSMLTGFAVFAYILGINVVLGFTRDDTFLLIQNTAANIFLEGVVPIGCTVGAWYVIRRRGAITFAQLGMFTLLSLALISQVYALWLSLSRGGILGLMVASFMALVLFLLAGRSRFFSRHAKTVVGALGGLAVMTSAIMGSQIAAQEVSEKGFEEPNLLLHRPFEPLSYTPDELDVSGRNLTLRELGNTGSLKYRITYWNVSMLIAADNLFTGVGLKNFGTVYGNYQYLGAGDVKTTHNDYLQVLTESGLFGFLFFVAFWVYFSIWGACRILLEANPYNRMILAGAYAGVMAFLIHAFIDFHFTNAALAMSVYAMTGLFFAQAYLDQGEAEAAGNRFFKPATLRIVGAGAACVIVLGAGATARLYLVDSAMTQQTANAYEKVMYIGDLRHFSKKMEVASYFLHDLRGGVDLNRPPFRSVSGVRELMTNTEDIKRLGPVRVPLTAGDGATRALRDDEAVPDDSYIFIIHPEVGYDLARKESLRIIKRLEEVLELWPDNTIVVNLLYDWNKLLAESAKEQKDKLAFSEETMKWGKRLTDLSPMNAWNHFNYGASLWVRADADLTARRIDYFREGLAKYQDAYELYPTSEELCRQYGDALIKMGEGFRSAKGLEAEGEKYLVEGKAMRERAHLISRYKTDVLGLR